MEMFFSYASCSLHNFEVEMDLQDFFPIKQTFFIVIINLSEQFLALLKFKQKN